MLGKSTIATFLMLVKNGQWDSVPGVFGCFYRHLIDLGEAILSHGKPVAMKHAYESLSFRIMSVEGEGR
jgi:hypothetical protein